MSAQISESAKIGAECPLLNTFNTLNTFKQL